tara:strand:+ start:251 stop:1282 length:1032 start_codon:yes stop_codon:yes gene_type:complete
MANFDTSAYAKAQSQLINVYKDAEMRTIEPVVLRMILSTTGIMLPDYKALKKSVARPIEGNFLTRTSRALGTGGPIHNHSGSQGVSAIQSFTWSAFDDKTVTTLKEANNSIFTLEQTSANKVQNVSLNFAEDLEARASAFLTANRTQVNIATVEGTFNATNDAFEITESTNGNRAIQITKSVMKLNKYAKFEHVVVCDTVSFNKFEFDAAQGAQNSTNLSFQYQGVTFLHDINLSAAAAAIDATYVKGFWEVVPRGSVSALPWLPIQNVTGVVTPESMYGNVFDPLTTLNIGTHSYWTRIDGTSLGGNTQDNSLETQYFVYVAFNTVPLTTATESSIFAFALI